MVPCYHCNRYQGVASSSVIRFCYSVVRGHLSAVVIREAIAGHENQVKFISEPNHGMYEAINKGL